MIDKPTIGKSNIHLQHILAQQQYQATVKKYTIIHKNNKVKTPLALGGFWYAPGLIFKNSLSAHEKLYYINLGYKIKVNPLR